MKRYLSVLLATLVFSAWPGTVRAEDCGVRGRDGADIVKFDCDPAIPSSTSRLKVRTSTGVRGIKLVDPGASGASKFRVRYTDTSVYPNTDVIKAMGKISANGISTCEELQMIGYHPDYSSSGTYKLGADIDCSATNPASSSYKLSLWEIGYDAYYQGKGYDGIGGTSDDSIPALALTRLKGKGFAPFGLYEGPVQKTYFSGTLDGKSHVVTNLFINRTDESNIGFLGFVRSGQIKDLTLLDVNVTGGGSVGGLAGVCYAGSIANVHVIGNVKGVGPVGGLVGYITGGTTSSGSLVASITNGTTISDSHVAGNITGNNTVGGLVGRASTETIYGYRPTVTISKSYAAGNVIGALPLYSDYLGGLVGLLCGYIINSYATCSVTGGREIGGLVGAFHGGTLLDTYAAGNITGNATIGGLVGRSYGQIVNSFALGETMPLGSSTGGLIGSLFAGFLTKNYWFSSNTVGVGSATPSGVTKAVSRESLYSPAHDVYQEDAGPASTMWDFRFAWKSYSNAPPRLRWEASS